MVTLLRPHEAVYCQCPEFKPQTLVLVSKCEDCEHLIEIRRPWIGWIVKCSFDGESDNATVEYE